MGHSSENVRKNHRCLLFLSSRVIIYAHLVETLTCRRLTGLENSNLSRPRPRRSWSGRRRVRGGGSDLGMVWGWNRPPPRQPEFITTEIPTCYFVPGQRKTVFLISFFAAKFQQNKNYGFFDTFNLKFWCIHRRVEVWFKEDFKNSATTEMTF